MRFNFTPWGAVGQDIEQRLEDLNHQSSSDVDEFFKHIKKTTDNLSDQLDVYETLMNISINQCLTDQTPISELFTKTLADFIFETSAQNGAADFTNFADWVSYLQQAHRMDLIKVLITSLAQSKIDEEDKNYAFVDVRNLWSEADQKDPIPLHSVMLRCLSDDQKDRLAEKCIEGVNLDFLDMMIPFATPKQAHNWVWTALSLRMPHTHALLSAEGIRAQLDPPAKQSKTKGSKL